MAILFHTCCGPCLGGTVAAFSEENVSIVAFWENPNIHPLQEYVFRLDSFVRLTRELDIPVIFGNTNYGLEQFLKALDGNFDDSRCAKCYRMRLESTAAVARQSGFEAFSTTLSISPYQNHELLNKIGQEISNIFGVPFVYRDLRSNFKTSFKVANDMNLYRQKYCGCIFSEKERFINDKKFLRKLSDLNFHQVQKS